MLRSKNAQIVWDLQYAGVVLVGLTRAREGLSVRSRQRGRARHMQARARLSMTAALLSRRAPCVYRKLDSARREAETR